MSRFQGAMRDLVPDLVIQIDDRGVFSASTDPKWVDAVVLDLLNHQFTCTILYNQSHTFRFYGGRGTTWQFKN